MTPSDLPNAKSTPRNPFVSYNSDEREKLRRIISERGLIGLANDTKWDEFINAIRSRTDWRPSYRFKCIDGPISDWDVGWFYHLPFPFLSVEWFDIGYLQKLRVHRLPPQEKIIDHSEWLIPLLEQVGMDYHVGADLIRIFGYSPRSFEMFDQ
ncbi:DUF6678 family protein [Telmatocola sphagniphila]|uniref:DUF6678 family protein n=1 Tax=Telmatocola sphagniphila TaxID=1123043 RepID=UPI0036F1DACC